MRELYREVKMELDGKEYTFQMKKFNAFEGGKTVDFIAKKLLPQIKTIFNLFKSIQVPENASKEELKKITEQRYDVVLEEISKLLGMISEDELVDIEKRCLKTVSVILPAGPQKVYTGQSFGFEELEYDTFACLALTVNVLIFNCASFFEESSLKLMMAKFNTMLQDA